MKRIAITLSTILFISLVSSCSQSKKEDEIATIKSLAEVTGSLDGSTYDYSFGPKGKWCLDKANEYITNVMGFNGSNGTSEMGDVAIAYRNACLNSN